MSMKEVSLHRELTAAEAALDVLSAQAKEAYRRYRELDAQQTVKATEVGELRQKLREVQQS